MPLCELAVLPLEYPLEIAATHREMSIAGVDIFADTEAFTVREHLSSYEDGALLAVSLDGIVDLLHFAAIVDELLPRAADIYSFSLLECASPASLRPLLSALVNMQHLIIVGGDDLPLDPNHFSDMHSPQLQSVLLVPGARWKCSASLSNVFVKIGHHLSALCLTGVDGEDADACVIQIAKYCPNLKILSLPGPFITDAAHKAIIALCPLITHLEITVDQDETLILAARSLQLESLHLHSGSDSLTDASLQAIAQYLPDSLKSLGVQNVSGFSAEGLIFVLQLCQRLKRFEFGSSRVPTTHLLTAPFIAELAPISTVGILSDEVSFTASTVSLLASLCPTIRHLRIKTPAFLANELTEIVTHCTSLRTLQLDEWNLGLAEHWQEINPDCYIEEIAHQCASDAFEPHFSLFVRN